MSIFFIYFFIGLVVGVSFGMMLAKKEKVVASERQKIIDELKNEIKILQNQNSSLLQEKTTLSTLLAAHKEDLESIQAKFVEAFENLSQKIVTVQTDKFDENSAKKLKALISPLQSKLDDFQKNVDHISSRHTLERVSLRQQVQQLMETTASLGQGADRLTNALQGDFRKQGIWGELILERVLEAAGLTEGREYLRNAEGLGLRGDENENLRPDVVVMLPDEKHLVIDAKMTFPHYYSYCNAENGDERNKYAEKLVESIEEKVGFLNNKSYFSASGINSVDFVVMFVPVESVFSLVITLKPELIEKSWNSGVILCGPTHLFSLLRTVACIWNIERQNQNTLEIAEKGAALHDTFAKLLDLMVKLGRQVSTVQSTYEEAMTKIKGRQGIIAKISQLKKLGLQTKEKLHQEFLDEAEAEDRIAIEGISVEGNNAPSSC